MTASALPVDPTSATLDELATLRPWFTPPPQIRVESLPVGCALAAACYALPDFARPLDTAGQHRWWPFFGGWHVVGSRRDELLAAAGFLLAAHGALSGQDIEPAAQLVEVEQLRQNLDGPHPGDPAHSTRPSAVDALAFAATCYALPPFARQTGVQGIPLLWPWPARLWSPSDRGTELLTACAMVVAEIERHPVAVIEQRRPALTVIAGQGLA